MDDTSNLLHIRELIPNYSIYRLLSRPDLVFTWQGVLSRIQQVAHKHGIKTCQGARKRFHVLNCGAVVRWEPSPKDNKCREFCPSADSLFCGCVFWSGERPCIVTTLVLEVPTVVKDLGPRPLSPQLSTDGCCSCWVRYEWTAQCCAVCSTQSF